MGVKVLLHILNVLYTILALAIAATSIWFFVEVQSLTSLRNSNHYMLDYTVYWPQAIPWLFLIAAIFAVCVSCCGFSGTRKSSSRLLVIFIICQSIAILALIGVAIIALVFADSQKTDIFVKDTVWDVYFQAKSDRAVETAFGLIERKLHCCGVDSPRDYKNWKDEFPKSCCDTYYHGWLEPYTIDCESTNQGANERHGCSAVAAQYARIFIKALSGASIFTAFIGIITLVVALTLSRSLKRTTRVVEQRSESESKKVLL